jgi:FixJ family two-component response regulator
MISVLLVASVTLEEYRARVSSLTPRENEVMNHRVLGKPGKRIAHDLPISYKTLEKHRSRVLQKMLVGSVALLVRLVMQFQQAHSA